MRTSQVLSDQPGRLSGILNNLPKQPGVYLFKDRRGDIIYIGKAAVLSDRVRSYFQHASDLTPKNRVLYSQIAELETIVTHSEFEALILESNLIKRHRPRFNVVLRDDKQYPYLRLPIHDDFPRLSIVRRVKQDKALYFGPYVPTGAMRDTLKVIRKVFPLATCTIDINGSAERACLEFEIKRCMAPCTGNQTKEAYHQIVKQVRWFLEGRDTELLESLRSAMQDASEREAFEEAARLRDQIGNIERMLAKQRVAQINAREQDIVGLARMGGAVDVQMLFVRGGLLIGRRDFFWSDAHGVTDEELVRSTLEQFYAKTVVPPKEVLLPVGFDDQSLVQRWLSEKKEKAVRVLVPERGVKYELLQLAQENAAVSLNEHLRVQTESSESVEELQSLLTLPQIPTRIECFDISNTMGTYSVASMVVWEQGRMKKSDYRRFRIKTVEGANDFASMHEVVKRRYGGSLANKPGKILPEPDLVVIDGGAGQLGAAMEAMAAVGLSRVAICGLAKAKGDKDERIFLPGRKTPIILPLKSPATRLVQTIRDEAHRFAITFHRKLRGDAMIPLPSLRSAKSSKGSS
ncbi:excinuclease ABC subunit UvrC [Candidatus Nitrospira neomarina]|uniref:UvrABC system protein C n=1 Tax=Candidatus Nitrospira neomarina TaxID=3020899 RepID=A0AA96JV75_9BACT|nr:excinuclease ABC subunit UvrC [Candidatus Nitrospira neomarina]WNM61482.1 excinuclease ABC subunit UvrC [Candidatus Nitrospira neomarina]